MSAKSERNFYDYLQKIFMENLFQVWIISYTCWHWLSLKFHHNHVYRINNKEGKLKINNHAKLLATISANEITHSNLQYLWITLNKQFKNRFHRRLRFKKHFFRQYNRINISRSFFIEPYAYKYHYLSSDNWTVALLHIIP